MAKKKEKPGRTIRKGFALLLAVLMVTAFLPTFAFADDTGDSAAETKFYIHNSVKEKTFKKGKTLHFTGSVRAVNGKIQKVTFRDTLNSKSGAQYDLNSVKVKVDGKKITLLRKPIASSSSLMVSTDRDLKQDSVMTITYNVRIIGNIKGEMLTNWLYASGIGVEEAMCGFSIEKAAPFKLKVTAGTRAAKLTWGPKQSGITGYKVYRKGADGEYDLVKTIKKASASKWTEKGLTSGKTYYYQMRSYKQKKGSGAVSTSGPTNTVKVKVK